VNRWKIAFIGLLVVAGIGGAAAAYGLLDQGVTLTYMQQAYAETIDDLEVLQRLLPAVAPRLTRADVLALLRRQHPGTFIVATDTSVQVGQLTFLFGPGGALQSIAHPISRSARP
jgi:hypothetical protein